MVLSFILIAVTYRQIVIQSDFVLGFLRWSITILCPKS